MPEPPVKDWQFFAVCAVVVVLYVAALFLWLTYGLGGIKQ